MKTEKVKANWQLSDLRKSYQEYGIGQRRLKELQDGCAEGRYSPETLQKACRGLGSIAPYILLSVTENLSYDALRVRWELKEIERPPIGRSDFYGIRRRFYHNLDLLLESEPGDVPMEEKKGV